MVAKLGHRFGHPLGFRLNDLVVPQLAIDTALGEIEASQGLIRTLQPDGLTSVSREMRAALAHEVGHIGHPNAVRQGKLSILAAPAVAVAAYELLRRHKAEPSASTHEAIERAPPQDTGMAGLPPDYIRAAKYVAIAALGLGAGSLLARKLSRAAEFAADRRAVLSTKDPEALISALTKVHKAADELMQEAPETGNAVRRFLDRTMLGFENATYNAHPELGERVTAIRGISL